MWVFHGLLRLLKGREFAPLLLQGKKEMGRVWPIFDSRLIEFLQR